MTLAATVVNTTIKNILRVLCRIDDENLNKVPQHGPLIIYCNHVNFLEVPLLYTHLLPRPVTGFAKAETWDNPAMAYLFNLWEAIPIRRGAPDFIAIRRGLEALKAGKILAVAPEGTRSGDGRLSKGHSGVVLIALQSGAPLLPLAYYGGECFWDNISRLRRTEFRILVGSPFLLKPPIGKVTRTIRNQMTDEIMYQLSALLPNQYRGYYSDLSKATENYLHFPVGSTSNLIQASSLSIT